MALYQNGTLISGANTLPQMTLAEYNALPVAERPTYWERTDLNYSNIPSSQVIYKNGSVEDALDGLETTIKYVTVPSGIFNYYDNEFSVIGEMVSVFFYATINGTLAGNGATICTLPDEAKIVNINLNNGTRKVAIFGKYNNYFGAFVGQVRPNGTIITATGSGTFSGDIVICGSYVR